MKNGLFEASDLIGIDMSHNGASLSRYGLETYQAERLVTKLNTLLAERDKVRDAELRDAFKKQLYDEMHASGILQDLKAQWLAELLRDAQVVKGFLDPYDGKLKFIDDSEVTVKDHTARLVDIRSIKETEERMSEEIKK